MQIHIDSLFTSKNMLLGLIKKMTMVHGKQARGNAKSYKFNRISIIVSKTKNRFLGVLIIIKNNNRIYVFFWLGG